MEIYWDDVCVKRNLKSFRVDFIEADVSVMVKKADVEAICEQVFSGDENLAAIILAAADVGRQMTKSEKGTPSEKMYNPQKIPAAKLVQSLKTLLSSGYASLEEYVSIFLDMRHQELYKLLTSDDPLEALKDI